MVRLIMVGSVVCAIVLTGAGWVLDGNSKLFDFRLQGAALVNEQDSVMVMHQGRRLAGRCIIALQRTAKLMCVTIVLFVLDRVIQHQQFAFQFQFRFHDSLSLPASRYALPM